MIFLKFEFESKLLKSREKCFLLKNGNESIRKRNVVDLLTRTTKKPIGQDWKPTKIRKKGNFFVFVRAVAKLIPTNGRCGATPTFA
ncbi:hypothetical protein DAPPUDRAFT_306631 [Daphnia pulex]|uniref:Uncharacterized protein n=1 Tax=Daphnia pulex TaxID=6669 RepID=E9GXS0_DAPPU|nr:hypothetical protein DAPPUDRAFT_306631 [Daphnia pulex]|eukprot:EFX75710.1 hypothetical protein DAPPUDRAFT_306631 [Daphnia pulex]